MRWKALFIYRSIYRQLLGVYRSIFHLMLKCLALLVSHRRYLSLNSLITCEEWGDSYAKDFAECANKSKQLKKGDASAATNLKRMYYESVLSFILLNLNVLCFALRGFHCLSIYKMAPNQNSKPNGSFDGVLVIAA